MFQHYLMTTLRNLWRFRGSTIVNIVGLALGLTSFIAAYATIAYVRSTDRHLENSDRIFVIGERYRSAGGLDSGAMVASSPPVAKYVRIDFPELEAVARVSPWLELAAVNGSNKALLKSAIADHELFKVLRLPLVAGDAAMALRQPRSVVLSEDAALRLFGTTNAVGHSVLLQSFVDATVTAVLAPIPQPSHMGASSSQLRFEILVSEDIRDDLERRWWGRAAIDRPEIQQWANTNGVTYVLLPANGALTAGVLNERLKTFAARHIPTERTRLERFDYRARHLSDIPLAALDNRLFQGSELSVVWLLYGLGGLVLLVACFNYANLTTAQAIARAKEVSMRRVLGARSSQLIVQHVLEAGCQTIIAAVLALVVVASLSAPLRIVTGIDLSAPMHDGFGFWIFVASVVALVSIAAGAWPAIVLSRVRPTQALRGSVLGVTSSAGPKFLVGMQLSAASLLLIATIVVYVQNQDLQRTGLAAQTDPVLVIENTLPTAGIEFETLRTELMTHPQIKAVSAVGVAPWSVNGSIDTLTRTPQGDTAHVLPITNSVRHDFIAALDMRLLAGRSFERARADESGMVIVDRALAAQLGWTIPSEAVDKIVYRPITPTPQPLRIIGVVENQPLRITSAIGATANVYTLQPTNATIPVVRISKSDVAGALASIAATWNTLVPNVPLRYRFMDELFEQAHAPFRQISRFVVTLTALAFVIATAGLIGMAVFVAGRRRHEIGIRKTLGASVAQTLTMLLKDFSKPVLIANVIAWPIAYIAAQKYLSVFIQRSPLSLLPFLLSLAITLLVAWAAVSGQAWRAARLNPATVLRHE
jgi:putative ABC transport system permease protein